MWGDYERFVDRGLGHPDELITIANICKEYGWTWDEYIDQPKPFIEAIWIRRDVEATVRERNNKELERQARLNGSRK